MEPRLDFNFGSSVLSLPVLGLGLGCRSPLHFLNFTPRDEVAC